MLSWPFWSPAAAAAADTCPIATCPTACGTGITKVGFVEYVAASWLGMLPGTFAYVYLGSLGKVAADAADAGAAGGFDSIKLALYGEHTERL